MSSNAGLNFARKILQQEGRQRKRGNEGEKQVTASVPPDCFAVATEMSRLRGEIGQRRDNANLTVNVHRTVRARSRLFVK